MHYQEKELVNKSCADAGRTNADPPISISAGTILTNLQKLMVHY